MANPKPSITLTKVNNSGNLKAKLDMLVNSDVLVGIPQSKNSRKGGKIGNAALLYIHTNGSPAQGIPKRPVIEPAINASGNKEPIKLELEAAAKAIMRDGNAALAFLHLNLAGKLGMNAAKVWFFDPRNMWPPNTPATIARKKSSQPLIDTGALRQALTYVVRTKP
jgi:hypothetical protein